VRQPQQEKRTLRADAIISDEGIENKDDKKCNKLVMMPFMEAAKIHAKINSFIMLYIKSDKYNLHWGT